MSVEKHRREAPDVVSFGIVTVSSTRRREEDESGDRIAAMVEEAGHRTTRRLLVGDVVSEIRTAVEGLADRGDVHVIVLTGGTGLAPSDVTPEAVEPLFEREIPGFGDIFRTLSFEDVGAAAMLSRAFAGIVDGCPVFVLPGSKPAVELAMGRLVLPEAGHLVALLRD